MVTEKNMKTRLLAAYKGGFWNLFRSAWRFLHNVITRRRFATAGKETLFGQRISIDGSIHVGDYSCVESDVVFRGGRVEIGRNSYIGHHTFFNATNHIKIGDNTLIAGFCYLVDANHGTELGMLIREQPLEVAPISIGNDVWLGARVVVLPGATIEDGAVIGANSVVSGHIPANAIAVGSPARVIKFRQKNSIE